MNDAEKDVLREIADIVALIVPGDADSIDRGDQVFSKINQLLSDVYAEETPAS